MTAGPRFSGGYQFPRSNAARLERGKPIQADRTPKGEWVMIVPLTGGIRKTFDVCAFYQDPGGTWINHSYIAADELQARAAYRQLHQEVFS